MAESTSALPPIVPTELLARFILFSNWIRTSNGTVRPDAFIPYPYPDLSVTRHVGISDIEIWQLGQAVADARPTTLYGRADIEAAVPLKLKLRIDPTVQPKNHANITGWPPDKPAQK